VDVGGVELGIPSFKSMLNEGHVGKSFTLNDLASCYTGHLVDGSLSKAILDSGAVKRSAVAGTYIRDYNRWSSANPEVVHSTLLEDVRVLGISMNSQGDVGRDFRLIRVALEGLIVARSGNVLRLGEMIGTVTPCAGPDGVGTVALGTGQMIASAMGVMIQQDALDLNKLSLMGMSPSTVPAHAARLPRPGESVLAMTRPTTYLSEDVTVQMHTPYSIIMVPHICMYVYIYIYISIYLSIYRSIHTHTHTSWRARPPHNAPTAHWLPLSPWPLRPSS